jgi:hypothetical protein
MKDAKKKPWHCQQFEAGPIAYIHVWADASYGENHQVGAGVECWCEPALRVAQEPEPFIEITREQLKQLLDNGERHAIVVSHFRPV